MKTPMQEHIEWLKKEYKKLESMGELGIALHIGDCIQNAESLLEKEKEVMSEIYAHDVSQQRELLEAYTQFLWTQHNNLTDADNNKLALEKFIASYCG